MTDSQLYLAVGVPVVINMLFNGLLIGIMWQHLGIDIREIRADLRVVTGKIYDLETRVSRIEDKLGIGPR